MHTEAIFTCRLEKAPHEQVADWEPFEVVRHFLDGEQDVLSEGCYYACRSSLDRYYRFLAKQESQYMVYWINESSFEVHENRLSHCA